MLTVVECYFICNEREHRAVDGDWLSICAASVSFTDPSSGTFQCCPYFHIQPF